MKEHQPDLFFHTVGRTQIEGVSEQGAEENVWTQTRGSGRRMEKII
jgi:hypothetical protein